MIKTDRYARFTVCMVAAVLAAALAARLYFVLTAPLQEAELAVWTPLIVYINTGEDTLAPPVGGHGLFHTLVMVHAGFWGDALVPLRALPFVCGLLTCMLLGLCLWRYAGGAAPWWGMLLCALWPAHVLWSATLAPQAFVGCLAVAALITAGRPGLAGFLLHLASLALLFAESWAAVVWLFLLLPVALPRYSRRQGLVWLGACALFAMLSWWSGWRGGPMGFERAAVALRPYFLIGGLYIGAMVAGNASARPLRILGAAVLLFSLSLSAAQAWRSPPVTDWRKIASHAGDARGEGEILTLRSELGELVQAAGQWPHPVYQTLNTLEELVWTAEAMPSREFAWMLEAHDPADLLIAYTALRGWNANTRVAYGAPTVTVIRITRPDDALPIQHAQGAAALRDAALSAEDLRLRLLAARILNRTGAREAAQDVAESIPWEAMPDTGFRRSVTDVLRELGSDLPADDWEGLAGAGRRLNQALAQAQLLQTQGRHDEAIALLQGFREESGDEGLLLRMLGDLLMESGKLEQAEARYAAIAPASPHYVHARTQMGLSRLRRGLPAEAMAPLESAIDAAQSGEGMAPMLLAEALVATGRASEIHQVHRELLEGAWPPCLTQAVLATGAEAQGDVSFALTLYRELIADAPDCMEAYGRADAILQRAATPRGRIAFWARLARDAPENTRVHFHQGLALGHAGMLEQAAACLERAVALQPNEPGSLTELAAIRFRQDARETALELANRAIAVSPAFARAHEVRLEILHAMGDREALLQAREEARSVGVHLEDRDDRHTAPF